MPNEWLEIDFSELNNLGIHFSRTHLKQWHDRKYCDAQEAQESIWHFGYMMGHTSKDKAPNSPLNFLMGVMHKTHYFSRPDGYLSREEQALKRRADDLKRKNDNLRRLQVEHFEEAFDIWFNSLTGLELQKLVPHFSGLDGKKATLKQVFSEEHWVTIRDNPEIDFTTLKLRSQAALEQALREEPLSSGDESSLEEARRIADSQFGKLGH